MKPLNFKLKIISLPTKRFKNLSCARHDTTYIIMACTSCSTSDGGAPKGCKNNGTCGTDSCNKLTVFDWLSNMSLPNGEAPFDCVEIRFKNGRKEFYRNTEKLTLSMGDIVATEASPGHDIGIVTLTGELVRIQMKKKRSQSYQHRCSKSIPKSITKRHRYLVCCTR